MVFKIRMAATLHVLMILVQAHAADITANDRPNFLWIVAEDISPFFGCYGHPDAVTPHIDKLAERSHVFLRVPGRTLPIRSSPPGCSNGR